MNGLPTRLNLCKRGVKIGPLCPICDQEMESITHALFQCDLALQVWNRWEGFPMNMRGNQLDVSDIALKIVNEGTVQDLEIFLVTAWTIWYCRNKNVFENVSFSDEQIWCSANTMRWEFEEASAVYCQSQINEATRWEVPPSGWVKINVDGATFSDGRPSSVGVIIRDSKGETMAALCEVLQGQYSSLETEIVALEKGILLAKEMALTQVIFESDALTLIQEILSKESNALI